MKRHLVLVLTMTIGLNTLAIREWLHLPDGMLHFHVFDVGQGDALLLITPSGKQVVVDGGPNVDLLEHLGRTMPVLDRHIELLILSHPDADHITGLPEVLRRYTIGAVLLGGAQHRSGRHDAFMSLLREKEIPIITANPDEDIHLGDGVMLDILWPNHDLFGTKPKDANNPSVVARVFYKDHTILLTGDIEEEAEEEILQSGRPLRASTLKVPHHGSRTSSSTGFLLAIQPEVGLISAGRDHSLGHPHQDVLDRYERLGIVARTTNEEESMHLIFE